MKPLKNGAIAISDGPHGGGTIIDMVIVLLILAAAMSPLPGNVSFPLKTLRVKP